MDEIKGAVLKPCIAGIIVAFIFGSTYIFDVTLKDVQREAGNRDKDLAFLKQKGNSYDCKLLLLEKLNYVLEKRIKNMETFVIELLQLERKKHELEKRIQETSDPQREASTRDEQLDILKQKVNKHDEKFHLLQEENKQLMDELSLIKQKKTDLQQEGRTRDEQLAILKQKVNKHDEKFPLLQEENKQLMDELSLIKQKKTEHYFWECFWTKYVNNFDEEFTYATENFVISGVSSYHDNGPEDRRFKFKVCKLLRR